MANTTSDPYSGDPLVSAHFMVTVSHAEFTVSAYFLEVGGLGSETEVTEHKLMAQNNQDVIRKIPGRTKWDAITMKRGMTRNMDFYNWRRIVETGNVDSARANITITMLDQAGAIVAEWTAEQAWPAKVSGPSLKSDSNDIAVEELTIHHEGIERTK
jgi:phage tail-like protein